MVGSLLLSTKQNAIAQRKKLNRIHHLILIICLVITCVISTRQVIEAYGDLTIPKSEAFSAILKYFCPHLVISLIISAIPILLFGKKVESYIDFYITHIEGRNSIGNSFHLRYEEIKNVEYRLAKSENDGALIIIANSVRHEISFPAKYYNAAERYFSEYNKNK